MSNEDDTKKGDQETRKDPDLERAERDQTDGDAVRRDENREKTGIVTSDEKPAGLDGKPIAKPDGGF